MSISLSENAYVNVGQSVTWPSFLPQPADVSILDHIWVQVLQAGATADRVGTRTNILIDQELVLSIPGLDAVALTISAVDGGTLIPLDLQIAPSFYVSVIDVPIGLRLKTDLFRPVRRVETGPDQPPQFELNPDKQHVDITLARVTLGADGDGNITFDVDGSIDLPPVMLGETGVVIEAHDIQIFLDTNSPPPGKATGWRGLYIGRAACYLPSDLASTVGSLSLTNCYIGNGGFSGTVASDWTPPLSTTLFGMQLSLSRVALTFVQNAFSEAEIRGQITLPYFDEPVDVEITPSLNGPFAVRLSSASGLISLNKPNILDLTIDSLGFEIDDGVFTAKLSGVVTPLVGGLDWPTFNVKELSIDSEGHVRLEGGWLDLPDQFALEFYGFQISITKIGFGRLDDGAKWIGFSGGLQLVEGLSAGASVEGLRVAWYEDGSKPVKITLNGVGVEFEVPDVVRFKGAVAYRDLTVDGQDVHRLEGRIVLEILSLDLRIEGTLVIGSATGTSGTYTFFAIYLDAELPGAIPLFSTGLGLYGMAGLFALNMEPDKRPDEPWYGIGAGEGWFKRPQIGVTDLTSKWVNRHGSLALGAGVTIGTVSDNGFTFSGKVLFVIVFPGPILLIEGKANLLKERAKLSEDPMFRALAVLDNRAGTMLIGLDARYKYGDSAELIDIRGSVEAYYNLNDPNVWHLYLGLREPRSKRIQADIFKLFEANAYWMLDARQLAMGAWIGYDKSWKFGPLRVTIEAWIEGNSTLSFKPVHLSGNLWLHGNAALKAFGFGASLFVDALVAAEVFDPFHLLAEFSVGISLPWPFDDISTDITLEWGPRGASPPIPMPLKEIAVEHFKVTESWPLPRESTPPLLAPNYDSNGDGFRQNPSETVTTQAGEEAPANAPVVPVDARPRITFGRAVHDDALVGVNPHPPSPSYERIGDPAKNEGPTRVRFGLKEVSLDRFVGSTWVTVARKADTANAAGVEELFGSWAPIPALPDGGGNAVAQTKLWLWSTTPFDYTRHSGAAWDDWFTDRFEDYPCPPPLTERTICVDFAFVRPTDVASSPWTVPNSEGLELQWTLPADLTLTILPSAIGGKTYALCFTGTPDAVVITPSTPASSVRIIVASPTPAPQPQRVCVDFQNVPIGQHANPLGVQNVDLTVYGFNGSPVANTSVITINTSAGLRKGLDCSFSVDIALPCPASSIEIAATRNAAEPIVRAFDTLGEIAAEVTWSGKKGEPHAVTLPGSGIVKVTIDSPQGETVLHEICYVCESGTGQSDISAVGTLEDGGSVGPVPAVGNVIEVTSPDRRLTRVTVLGKQVCVLEICCTIPPDPDEVTAREDMAQHIRDELARWTRTGAVLQSHSTYRLKVVTTIATQDADIGNYEHAEFAYFRTQGPPGLAQLSEPIGYSNTGAFTSALSDLTRYVRQTVPATVPPPGQPPRLPRPVYRGYDVGVEFNEDYVDAMYALDRRDLGLYLFDNNSQPLRDELGRLVVLPNRWGRTDMLTLTESETRWIATVNASTCIDEDVTSIPHDRTLVVGENGLVLAPDTVHEARLVPLLLHETFNDDTGEELGGWLVHDEAPNNGPSHWEVRETGEPPSRYVIQTTNVGGGTPDGRDPVKPGTLLLRADDPNRPSPDSGQPGNWTNYRLSLYVRSEQENTIGVVFRYQDEDNHYRFAMDRERKYRRLMRLQDGQTTVLAEDDWVYQLNTDYLVTIEAIGDALSVYLDEMPAFAVRDNAFDRGRIGLYCWANQGARFSDIRVDDYRDDAPVPYRFKFTTSRFVNVFHHLHDFDDETWLSDVGVSAIDTAIAQGVTLPAAMTEPESRAYDTLAQAVLGQQALATVQRVGVTRVEQNGVPVCLFIQTAEPVASTRTSLELKHALRVSPAAERPETVKLTDVTFAGAQPNDESVTVLLREATRLAGDRIERLAMPTPLLRATGDPLFFRDDFDGNSGLLFHETFGPNALDRYAIVDQGTLQGPSAWSVIGGRIVQTNNIWGGSLAATAPEKPGTVALVGEPTWDNVRITVSLGSNDNDSIGVVFRYQGEESYYRFSIDAERSFRRLVKRRAGTTTVLWEDAVAYTPGTTYNLEILASGDRLLGYLNEVLLFCIRDADITSGRVGLYCWADTGVFFSAFDVEQLATSTVLWNPVFDDLTEVEISTATGATGAPAVWSAASGTLAQTSDVHILSSAPDQLGTAAIGRTARWTDMQISARLRSTTGGAIGVMFRYQDDGNYYRFSMDDATSYRRLVKRVNGVTTLLWEDVTTGYAVDQTYALTIRARGSEIRVVLNGALLVTRFDDDLADGRVALYCSSNAGATFGKVLVADATRRVGSWTIRDDTTTAGPSVWRQRDGTLVQAAAIGGGDSPDLPGTIAFAGSGDWQDYRLRVRLRSDGDGAMGVLFRYVGGDTHYRLSMDRAQHYRRLIKRVDGAVTTLWEDATPYASGATTEITIDAIGSRLTGYVDGTLLFSLNDSGIPAGRIGLYAWNNPDVRFDRVEVRSPSLEARALFRDRFADGNMDDWTIVDEGNQSAPSAWAAANGVLHQTSNIFSLPIVRNDLAKRGTMAVAGDPTWRNATVTARLESDDNDTIGLLVRYTDSSNFYRFSMDRELGYRRLVKCVAGVFTLLWEDNAQYETGRPYEITISLTGNLVRGYVDGVPTFAIEDASLPAGRIGLYCWRNQDARFSQVRVLPAQVAISGALLDDPLRVLVAGRWLFVDDGDQDAPSQWDIVAGALQQSSTIHGGDESATAVEKPGTSAIAGDLGWTDYRLTVRLRSDTPEGIGVVFRYADSSKYYRFSMDRTRNFRRLTRHAAGVVTTLWQDSVAFEVGREYLVTVDCVGTRLSVYVDGIRLCALDDEAHPRGRIGLYCWKNDAARFSELVVAAPQWVSFYAFDEDDSLPAGSRIRVHGGPESAPHAAQPDMLSRFAAGVGEDGMITFGSDSIKLRLRSPRSARGHAREFLGPSHWVTVAPRILRKADETAFFLLVPSAASPGSELTPGTYRLSLSYRRDNTAGDPLSQVLRQAGDSSPEVVTIDVPWHAH